MNATCRWMMGIPAAALLAVLVAACTAQSGGTDGSTSLAVSTSTSIPLVNVSVTPDSLEAGGAVTVKWNTVNATSCSANGAWKGALPTSNTLGSSIGPLSKGTYTFGVTCIGSGGSSAASQVVTVGSVPSPTIKFSDFAASVKTGDSDTLDWTTSNATGCEGLNGATDVSWDQDQPIDDSGFNTGDLTKSGQWEFTLECWGPGGTTSATEIISVNSNAPPAPPTITAFVAQPSQIRPGQSTSFTWSSNATSCTASGGSGADKWSGSEPVSSTGTTVGPIAAGRYSYTLTCAGPGGNTAQTVSVVATNSTQGALVGVNLDVWPVAVTQGDSAALTWTTTNADTCMASGSWSGSKPLEGNAESTGTLTTAGVYTYTLTCAGTGGSSGVGSAMLTVNPAPATVGTFQASPTSIETGQSTSLSWTSADATSCTAAGGTGSDGWPGTQPTSSAGTGITISTSGTFTYSIACTGPGGASAPASVNVVATSSSPPVATVTNLTVSPASIQAGQSASVSWSSGNASSCTASGGTGNGADGWTGSVGTSSVGTTVGPLANPGTYVYTLTCAGPGGTSAASSVALNVTAGAPPPATVGNFAATPSTIPTNQASSLSWSSNGATSCTASGGTGSDGWTSVTSISSNGTSTGPIATAGTYPYTLTCTGPGGTGAPSSVTVNVYDPASSAAQISSFSAASSSLQTGQSTSLAWTTANATSCNASGGGGSDSWGNGVPTSSTNTPIGPFATAGTYTYTLNCSGSGGASGPSSVTINVTNPPPAATVTTFTATPSSLTTGQSSSLAWTSSGASSCTATGGTGSDGWPGTVATSSSGVSTGSINSAGSYTYTLACTGPGGMGPSSSVIVNVASTPPPAPTVNSFVVSPNSIVVGQSTSLSWATTSATSCAASGGTGSDGWTGSVGASSSGTPIGPINSAGVYTYTLTCMGPGGTTPSSVTLDVTAAPAAPSINTFSVSPTAVQTGQSVLASWSSSNATSCNGSGGTGTDGWSGSLPSGSTGTSFGPLTPAGNYTYTLTCTGAGGTSAPSSQSVTVTDAAQPATVTSFRASPSAMQTGNATTLSWSSLNATGCTAGGAVGAYGWSGTVPTSSTGDTLSAIATAGTYTFTLFCSGPGGNSTVSSAVVNVTNTTPPASIVSFTATPMTITAGNSVQLSWATNGASACTGSSGTGSDGWAGSQPTSSAGTTVGPLNTTGLIVYTLNCTGPGGASSPVSVDVTVNAATPAAAIGSFSATPSTVTVGQSTKLAWSSTNATSCTAGGGTGSDGWTGLMSPSSSGTTVGPFTTAGAVTYTLTCVGAGGTSAPSSTSITVNAALPAQPTVSLLVNGLSAATIQPGASPKLTWTSTNATSCTASGGAVTDGWSGSQPISSTGTTVGPDNTPGIYVYTLTCSGSGGSGSSAVRVTVISSDSTDCGIPGMPSTSLVSPAATALDTVQGLCVGCSVAGIGNVINAATSSPAQITELAGVLGGSVTLQVSDSSADFPSGRQVGFIVSNGNTLLNLGLLQNVVITTYLNGAPQQSASVANNLLTLQALGVLSVNPYAGFAGFTATKPFDQVSVQVQQLAGLLTTLNVYRACASLQ